MASCELGEGLLVSSIDSSILGATRCVSSSFSSDFLAPPPRCSRSHVCHCSFLLSGSAFCAWMCSRVQVELPAEATALLDRWSALHRPPVAGRPLFLMTEFDLLQPYALQQSWWQTWNRPESHRYRHGHMSVLFCKQLPRPGDLRRRLCRE